MNIEITEEQKEKLIKDLEMIYAALMSEKRQTSLQVFKSLFSQLEILGLKKEFMAGVKKDYPQYNPDLFEIYFNDEYEPCAKRLKLVKVS